MKRLLNSIKFLSKAVLLISLLIFGWAFVNITNLVKGKKSAEKWQGTGGLFGSDEAKADSDPGKGASTPFLAYHNGKEYKLENDIMFGRPKSYYPDYKVAKSLYEDGRISPDLYKIAATLKPQNGKLLFQIQEIELEESFIKWLELKRVIHPEGTEVIVDSEYKKFHVLERAVLEKDVVLPESVTSSNGSEVGKTIADKKLIWGIEPGRQNPVFISKGENLDIIFRNLKPGEIPYLVVKSWFRDWVLGLEEDWINNKRVAFSSLNFSDFLKTAASLPLVLLAFWFFQRRGLDGLALAPFVVGSGSMCGKGGCSLEYEFINEAGEHYAVGRSEPRAWHYNTEIIELPREAVRSDGELHLRILSSKKHAIGFVGAVQNLKTVPYKEEGLSLTSAYHRRLQKETRDSFRSHKKEYVHTIPGDAVDLEFETPKTALKNTERETYLMRTSGFYTPLRPESRTLAGNWQEKISEEAKTRLASAVRLKNYS